MDEETNPGLIARADDTLTDVKRRVAQAKTTMEDLSQRVREFDDRLPSPDAVLDSLADFTRRNPLLALGAAVAVGLWINRRR